MSRISWNQYFMAQSHLLALRSTCTRLTVGATIVRDKRIIAGGYNGSVAGGEHCIDEGCYVVDNHCIRTIHAEMNAILQCAKFGVPTAGAEIYVTHFPCLQCCKAIIQSGIKAVYYANDYRNNEYGEMLFKQSGVKVEKVPYEDKYGYTDHQQKKELAEQLLNELKSCQADEKKVTEYQEKISDLFGK
ncbi:MAG: ComE operon protein 2 [Bacillus sp. (in: firmicutes)]